MVINPEFFSNACVSFAAGPIGAAAAVFLSNYGIEKSNEQRGEVSVRVSMRCTGSAYAYCNSNPLRFIAKATRKGCSSQTAIRILRGRRTEIQRVSVWKNSSR
jgi:hypothetical protein